ncbi:protein phosphatase 2C domain-containing protein [Micromonospora sp. 4G57]|uniref:Protein phosphatase 2C domain-containing protein n=1 Tax=Micromonospora sicca TaxID=2202420 RepID=A0ABU5JGU5_9ACTN|nr:MULTISPECIES: protein phosphatase 2C domain-containing protein [unclassified Micromonospora]MDZ5444033.1 protein phosphatase 2C domain-containing protein [Micromonospora sp. 4G57]MDZ5491840.1 protein phosphatase 2C domain-containing protein [Micromonospora sp. 4G53]
MDTVRAARRRRIDAIDLPLHVVGDAMDFAFATEPGPGRPNEDHVIVSAGFAIVLDGVTQPPDLDTGCVHDPVWLVRELGSCLVEALTVEPTAPLDLTLAAAIDRVRGRHGGRCDLTDPNSPSSTVAIVRERGDQVDYLVLCDSSVVFEDGAGITVIHDDRTETLPAYDRHTVARLRNRPEGFWVASTDPAAAAEALTGSVARNRLRRLLLCTDGISRLTEFFRLSWGEVFSLVERSGPRAAVDAVRRYEVACPELLTRPGRARVKRHDDATIAVLHSRA